MQKTLKGLTFIPSSHAQKGDCHGMCFITSRKQHSNFEIRFLLNQLLKEALEL